MADVDWPKFKSLRNSYENAKHALLQAERATADSEEHERGLRKRLRELKCELEIVLFPEDDEEEDEPPLRRKKKRKKKRRPRDDDEEDDFPL